MRNKSFFDIVSCFVRKYKNVLKTVGLLLLVLYFLCLFIANISYFKYDKREIGIFPKMTFGIDIVGGNQITVAIDSSGVVSENIASAKELIASFCKEKSVDCVIANGTKGTGEYFISTKFKLKSGEKSNVKEVIKGIKVLFQQFDVGVVKNDFPDVDIDIIMTKEAITKIIADTTDKAILILKNRIDGVGVKEITIQRYGADKIVILVPRGVSVGDIKRIVNTTAKLEFHLMDRQHIFSFQPKEILKNHKLLPSYDKGSGLYYLVEEKAVLTGESITSVQPSIDGINNAINFRMNASGTKKFAEITENNRGRLLAILLDDAVLMAPMINTSILNGAGSITGHFSTEEVMNLSVLLRSGSLPAKVSVVNEKQLSSIFDKSILSKISGIVVLLLFVVAVILCSRYRSLGLVTVIALVLNFIFTFGLMSIFGFTLTLPGIAGFVLMLGMATDANILIYEKMKDVARNGIKYKESVINNGFSRAIGTIFDANITTIIASIALFSFGGSFIKGFSITLIAGILCGLFTSVNITRMTIDFLYRKKNYINV